MYFFDEGRFGLKSTFIRMWTRKGVTPKVRVIQDYKNFYTFCAVSPQTGDHFSLFFPEVNTEMMNLYPSEFAKEHPGEEILLIMDRAGWHCSKNLKIPQHIQIMYLSPYSPELNPVERLWRHLKAQTIHNRLFQDLTSLMDALQQEIRSLTSTTLLSVCRCRYLSPLNQDIL